MAKSTVEENKSADNNPDDPNTATGSSGIAAAQTESASPLVSLQKFLAESALELKKISWPDRAQVVRETLSVIVLVTIITALVIGFDLAVGKWVFEPLDHFARQLGGGIGATHK